MNLIKKNKIFLNNNFPENLLPLKKLNRNRRKLLKTKKGYLKKNIRKATKTIISQHTVLKNFKTLSTSLLSHTNRDSKKATAFTKVKPTVQASLTRFFFNINQLRLNLNKKQSTNRTFSDFKKQLLERKKLSILYGNLPKKQIQNCYKKACQATLGFAAQKKIHEQLVLLLETRLDIVLFRACFFKNILSARQCITQKKVLVNGKIVSIASYYVQPGDVILINRKYSQKYATLMTQHLLMHSPFYYQYKKNKKLRNSIFSLPLDLQKQLETPFANKQQQKKFLMQLKSLIHMPKSESKFFITKLAPKYDYLTKRTVDILFHLTTKKLMVKKKKIRKYVALRYSNMKPLNLEVSHKLSTVIYLYPPQKIVLPATIDLSLVTKSL